MRLLNGTTGVPISTLEGHSNSIQHLSFSYDGSQLASESFNEMVRLWDSATGLPIALLEGHSKYVNTSFSPNHS